jgi:hypothetical protein
LSAVERSWGYNDNVLPVFESFLKKISIKRVILNTYYNQRTARTPVLNN